MPASILHKRYRVCVRSGPMYQEIRDDPTPSGAHSFTVAVGTDFEEVMHDLGIDYGHTVIGCQSLADAENEAERLTQQWMLTGAVSTVFDTTPSTLGRSPIDGRQLVPHALAETTKALRAAAANAGAAQLFG